MAAIANNQAPSIPQQAPSTTEKTKVISLKAACIYQKKQLILDQVSLDIMQGEFLYLVGKTGAGKTSLLRTLYADLPLKEGTGEVVGFDLQEMKTKQVPFLRRRLGIIFQDFHLLTDRTVVDNLDFALRATDWKDEKAINQRIDLVLHVVGLGHKKHQMPYQLSGGEQQRIVIARALLNDPALILADEPTGNLDPETSEEIIQLLMQISEETDTTVIVGTHDYQIIEKFPSPRLHCVDGRVLYEPVVAPKS